jgi:hypothetical protein
MTSRNVVRRFEGAVAEALAAEEAADRSQQLTAAEFASSRIDRMPTHFRIGIRTLGGGLLLADSIRWRRWFWSLSPGPRARSVARWEDAPISVVRLYAKTLRSFVLLSVYEDQMRRPDR